MIRARYAAIVLAGAIGVAGTCPVAAQPAATQDEPASSGMPQAVGASPGPFKPDADEAEPDVWIFSGELQNSKETFSGTLVAKKGDAQFELKLSGGATCDGSDVSGEIGLVRLSEITCSDDRTMRALFVPQNGQELKVFGHVGEERFAASAHLLGTEPVPEKKQTTEPTAPALQQRPGDPVAPGGAVGPAPAR